MLNVPFALDHFHFSAANFLVKRKQARTLPVPLTLRALFVFFSGAMSVLISRSKHWRGSERLPDFVSNRSPRTI
jgi:hypothetical protein